MECFPKFVIGFIVILCSSRLETNGETHSLMLGYDPVDRSHTDLWTNAMIISDPLQQAMLWGKVTGFHYYATGTDPVYLQVWRLTITSGYWFYTLVGGKKVTPQKVGYGEVTLGSSEQFDINFGDVLGLTFHGSNPIPYSVRKPCRQKSTFRFVKNNGSVADGSKLLPVVGDSQWDPCRYYSFRAILSCNPATSAGHCYEKYVQERCSMANPIILASNNGALTSHSGRYETYYDAGLNCGISISVAEGSRVRIDFPTFALSGDSTACTITDNNLKIYEGSDTSGTLLGHFCGNSVPGVIYTCSHNAYMVFASTTIGIGGFNITFTSEPAAATCVEDDSAVLIAVLIASIMVTIIIAVVVGLYIRHYRKRTRHRKRSASSTSTSSSQKKSRHSSRVAAMREEYTGPMLMVPAADYYDQPPAYLPMGGADTMAKVVSR